MEGTTKGRPPLHLSLRRATSCRDGIVSSSAAASTNPTITPSGGGLLSNQLRRGTSYRDGITAASDYDTGKQFTRRPRPLSYHEDSDDHDDTGGGNHGYHDNYMSSFDDDDSYSGSDLDDDSFAMYDDEDEDESYYSEDDGIVSPEESRKKNKKQRRVAAKEHQRVFRARIFVLLLLAITAISNALIVYFLTTNREQDDFDRHYNEITREITRMTHDNVRVAFLGMDGMSTALTTLYLDQQQSSSSLSSWPRVTFPTFATLAAEARNVTGAYQIILVPIVPESQRTEWESYSVQHQDWVREENYGDYHRALLEKTTNNSSTSRTRSIIVPFQSTSPPIQYQSTDIKTIIEPLADSSLPDQLLTQNIPQQSESESKGPADPDRRQLHQDAEFRGVIPSRIHPAPTREERLAPGMKYAPVWQMSPPPYYRGIINHDLFREPTFQSLSEMVLQTRQPIISNRLQDELVPLLLKDHNAEFNPYSEYYGTTSNNHDHDHDHDHDHYPPTSVLVQPVWESFDSNANLGGFLIALIPWEQFLVDAFRDNSEDSALAQFIEAAVDTSSTSSLCPSSMSSEDGTSGDATNVRLNYHIAGGDNVDYLGPGESFPGDDKYVFSMKKKLMFPTQPQTSSIEVGETMLFGAENTTTSTNKDDEMTLPQSQSTATTSSQDTSCRVLQIHMYPSHELKGTYITNWPSYYAAWIILVFVVLASVFFIYDCLVERRRGRVMAVAEKTSRIVSSLFPGQFADQLISENKKKEQEANKKKKKKKKVVIEEAPNRRLKKFIKDKKMNGSHNGMNGSAQAQNEALGYGDAVPDGDDSPLFLAQSKPIADLFPETTVLFADIAGFTAWSSVREPSQVFTLLETVYQNFDFLAKQYGIFKVETIGDCYVAVCGLPEPRTDHAVAMSRFALACMSKMQVLVSQLEITLGPDTEDLTMRFGLHSGPVTAGVLRGERARFQLFGDTVNTAARMESTGLRDKIQVSQETADLLVAAGKTHWFTKREGLVKAKGKGEPQTYWLQASGTQRRQSMGGPQRRGSMGGPQRRGSVGGLQRRGSVGGMQRRALLGGPSRSPSQREIFGKSTNYPPTSLKINRRFNAHPSGRNIVSRLQSIESDSSDSYDPECQRVQSENPLLMMGKVLTKKQQRLVDWNCELLQQLLRQIVARRNRTKNAPKTITSPFAAMMSELPKLGTIIQGNTNGMPLDEVVEVINLPEFDVAAYHASNDAKHIKLDATIVTQLRRFVTILASKYRENPFHSFDHASHVAMSVSKLLSRIVAPDLASINDRHSNEDINSSLHLAHDMKDLHDYTYGITSDPLTQFAVVLSALIHDVDHRGVPNNILIKEEPELAERYRRKSVAEQNSVDIAWSIFMDDGFKALRDTICTDFSELRRLRQIIINSVLATDIFDPELSALRKARWNKAFQKDKEQDVTAFGPRRASFIHLASNRSSVNRKATIVIEHLIQASDVAHCMQHWHIYKKWNECLFHEMYAAYKDGRSDKDPSEGWYKGEIWFFDNYIIPLAKKLTECGVFGVSSDEYLDYSTSNRAEWAEKGEDIVAQMLSKYRDVFDRATLGYE